MEGAQSVAPSVLGVGIRKILAEFVGTFTLIFIGAGAVIIFAAGGPADLTTVALAHGLAIGTMVSAVGHVSGGYFNPAITIGAWVARRLDTKTALTFLVTQLAGATAGAAVLRGTLPQRIWGPSELGATQVELVSDLQAMVIEGVLTFFLVWVVFATAVDSEGSFGKVAGLAIGFVIAMDIMMAGPFTGGSMNPARTFGPALVAGFWETHWVYWVGPVAGAVAAAGAYELGVLRKVEGTIELESAPPAPPPPTP